MDSSVLIDIRNWIPHLTMELKLDDSDKVKKEMYVEDLYTVLYALWAEDPKALHGRLRVQTALILLLSAATGTRPGALVESDACRDSNKALKYEDITFMVVANPAKPGCGKTRRKHFIFREEDNLAFCVVSLLMALALDDNAFVDGFQTPQQIFGLRESPHRKVLRLRWTKEASRLPVFRDVCDTGSGIRVSTTALRIGKYRQFFICFGRVCGFESSLEPYQIRRASGQKLNAALTPSERNKILGHSDGAIYDEFYAPNLIPKDLQSIYFGTTSQTTLIEAISRIGLSRDKRAPTGISSEKEFELKNDPSLLELKNRRERCRAKMRGRYGTVKASEGTKWYRKYINIKAEENKVRASLSRTKLKESIKSFHANIDSIEIGKQLAGDLQESPPSPRAVRFELRERENVVNLLFGNQKQNACRDSHRNAQSKLINNLVLLCKKQESRDFHKSCTKQNERACKYENIDWTQQSPEGTEQAHGNNPDQDPGSPRVADKDTASSSLELCGEGEDDAHSNKSTASCARLSP
ncbi:MAG: hypothetical protein M1828_006150 [Chrysothrix sp. TS-e1954]|nr:MAG: hypothetical protein M1828_006150 [Chrysothrix sp. TS-e1954]